MRFHHMFKRTAGDGGKPFELPDNKMSCRLCNTNGYPVQRGVVGLKGLNSATVTLWFKEDLTDSWFELGTQSVNPDCLVYFDLPTMADGAKTGDPCQPGCLELCLEVRGLTVEGEHTFVLGADVSSPG